MASEDGRFDTLLLNIAQNQSGGIDGLLDTFFGFLRRKTDFFTGQPRPVVSKTLLTAVERQFALAERQRAAAAAAAPPAPAPAPIAPDVVEVGTDGEFDASTAAAGASGSSAAAPAPAPVPAKGEEGEEDEEGGGPGLVGNGGSTAHYSWTQTLQDVNVTVPVPAGIKGRDVVCDISAGHIKFGLRGAEPMVDAALHKAVKADECYWTLETSAQGRTLDVYLQKANGMEWWKAIAEGEPEIDTAKVEPENSKLGDLDAETRKTVEKMMFDQRQKAMGRPSSDELQKQEMLAKFMAQHPEMDFTNAKIT